MATLVSLRFQRNAFRVFATLITKVTIALSYTYLSRMYVYVYVCMQLIGCGARAMLLTVVSGLKNLFSVLW